MWRDKGAWTVDHEYLDQKERELRPEERGRKKHDFERLVDGGVGVCCGVIDWESTEGYKHNLLVDIVGGWGICFFFYQYSLAA